MKKFVKNDDGTVYEAFQTDENTYTFETETKMYKLSLSESKSVNKFSALTEDKREKMTKAIFSNEKLLEQLKDAKKNRGNEFSYYSGNEADFEKLVDEVNNDR